MFVIAKIYNKRSSIMSRIGKLPVIVPEKVTVIIENNTVSVNGPKGVLSYTLPAEVGVDYAEGKIKVTPKAQTYRSKSMWGLSRTLVFNMVQGVFEGWSKRLEINGVGYKAAVNDNLLILNLGYSHEIFYAIPTSITIKCEKPTVIAIYGCDKQLVGQVAAEIRQLRKPEPYKGKGIKYENEIIRRKEGKKKTK